MSGDTENPAAAAAADAVSREHSWESDGKRGSGLVPVAAPSLETIWLWSADGARPTSLARCLQAFATLLLLGEAARMALGGQSEITWDVLENKYAYQADYLGRNFSQEQADYIAASQIAGGSLADLATFAMSFAIIAILESLMRVSRPQNGELAVLFHEAMVTDADLKALRCFWRGGLCVLTAWTTAFFVWITGNNSKELLYGYDGTITFTNCRPLPSWEDGQRMEIPRDWDWLRRSHERQLEFKLGLGDEGMCDANTDRWTKDFARLNAHHFELDVQTIDAGMKFVVGSLIGRVVDGLVYLMMFGLAARNVYVLRFASTVAKQRVHTVRSDLSDVAEVSKDWDALQRRLRVLCQETVPCVTKGFASGIVSAVIAWLFMWACWVSIAFQQASRHGIEGITYTFIILMTVLVVSPVYIPADVTTACQKLYGSLNEIYASDDVEQTIELEHTIERFNRYLARQNDGQGLGFAVFGIVVSKKLIKQAITGAGAVALTLGPSFMPHDIANK